MPKPNINLDKLFCEARSVFKNFPEEVFALWLDDCIRQNGWPPHGIEWEGYLNGESIDYWKSLKWHRKAIEILPGDIASASHAMIEQIIRAAEGRVNIMSRYAPDTVNRFYSSMEYIKKNGTTPGRILLLLTENGYWIIDGNHRLSAYLMYQTCFPVIPVDAWIASSEFY